MWNVHYCSAVHGKVQAVCECSENVENSSIVLFVVRYAGVVRKFPNGTPIC